MAKVDFGKIIDTLYTFWVNNNKKNSPQLHTGAKFKNVNGQTLTKGTFKALAKPSDMQGRSGMELKDKQGEKQITLHKKIGDFLFFLFIPLETSRRKCLNNWK